MDTAFLYIALAEQALTDCIRPDMKAEWENMRSTDCDDSFTADVSGNFSPELAARNTRKRTRESRVSSKKNSGVQNCSLFVVKLIAVTILPLTS